MVQIFMLMRLFFFLNKLKYLKIIITSFVFFICLLFNPKTILTDSENFYFMYPFTAKELVIECEKWIPNQTAEQQKSTREVPCIRYIQSTINTYQTIQLDFSQNLQDLCIPKMLNIKRQKDIFITYVKKYPDKENLIASKVILEALTKTYCK